MKNNFYFRLAAINLKTNAKLYIPYLLACIGTIMMFYIVIFLAANPYSRENGTLSVLMILGAIVISIFSVILLFYTNSFLIKRRKKEIGLYNILGMEKKNLACVMSIETLYVAVISITLGLVLGIVLSRLLLLLLGKMLKFSIGYEFLISKVGIILTVCMFAAIFVLTLVKNILSVSTAKPIELLHGSNVGEREPKTKWPLTIIGLLSLGGGYYIAVTTESPLSAIGLFFIAVILVIIGTYSLFVAGSITLLKLLRKNKKYYYKPNHFTSVSGMLYRMKQNAVGLANICILSIMVLVMVSGTTALFIGFEDAMRSMFIRNVELTAFGTTKESLELEKTYVDSFITNENLIERGLISSPDENLLETYSNSVISTCYSNTTLKREKELFTFSGSTAMAVGSCDCYFIPLEYYKKLSGRELELNENEILLNSNIKKFNPDSLLFNDRKYDVIENIDTTGWYNYPEYYPINVCFFIVKDEAVMETIYSSLGCEKNYRLDSSLAFDLSLEPEMQRNLATELNKFIGEAQGLTYNRLTYNSSALMREVYLSVYGGLFFLGVFLGILFVMATVLIMYYKQVSEGYEDKERFEIMQKVGMSAEEVKATIHSQVITVFFLPLVTAIIHLAFAFKCITKLLTVLSVYNTPLVAICTLVTIAVFTLIYTAVYKITARSYYRIVKR